MKNSKIVLKAQSKILDRNNNKITKYKKKKFFILFNKI